MKNRTLYHWTIKDKLRYLISLIPFIIAFIGTLLLLSTISIYLISLFLFFYLLINVFQAGCCIGCPYRGKYCPAFFGVYLGNILSNQLYKNKTFDQKFHEKNAKLGEIFCLILVVFPLYWLFTIGWFYPIIFLFLIGLHVILFLPLQCPKCSYNEICPGGKAYSKLFKK